MRGEIVHVGESAAKIGEGLANVGTIFANQGINVIDGFVGFIGSLAEIRQQRLEFFADRIDVLKGCVESWTILFEHAASIGESGGKIGAILDTEKIVDTVDGDFQLSSAIVQGGDQLGSVRTEFIDLRGDGVEIHVGFGSELRTIGSNGSFGGAGKNLDMIVAKRAHAHDFDVAVGFNGEIGLDFENDFDAGGILRIDADSVDAANFGTSGVADARTGLDTSGKGKKRVICVGGASESAANGENGADQDGGGNDDEQTDKCLFAFRIHGSLPCSSNY